MTNGPDIFVSYAAENRARAGRLVQALRQRSWSVAWDQDIAPGTRFREAIAASIARSTIVLVIWSPHSIASRYVQDEANLAVKRGVFFPVRIAEIADYPLGFDSFHALDLSAWHDGEPPEALLLALARRIADAAARAEMLEQMAKERGVPLAALTAQLERLGELDVSPEQVPARIATFVTGYLQLKADFARATNADPEIARTHQRALELLNAGDLDEARKQFDSALARMRERQQQASREMATLLADRASVDRLQLHYRDAARAYEEAADLVHFDREAALVHLEKSIGALNRQGEEFGDNAALLRAIETIRDRALPLVSRAQAPLDWSRLQVWLGNALSRLGQRQSEPGRLEEAVATYRAVLEEYTRERVPMDWAMAQNNLGTALAALGERERGATRLEEAVVAFRAALHERTRERAPRNWAATQTNLASALAAIGERESGTARLEEAVVAFRAVLEERTRESVPLDWARTQNNLGTALKTLGERESGTARLEEAVAAFRAALQERARERVPLDWATTQHNLGAALASLGEREGGIAHLEEAVAAFRAALLERTPERTPFFHARTKTNLDIALAMLAKRQSN